MNTKIVLGVLGVLALLGIGMYIGQPKELEVPVAGMPFVEVQNFQQGLKAGTRDQFSIDSSGDFGLTSTGTSTLTMKSTSSTKGWCTEFNATSSATVLNMSFGATTTATTVGVEPIIRYGACN